MAKKGSENELLVFFTKGRLYVSGAQTDLDNIQPYHTVFEDVFNKVACSPDEKSLNWNADKFWQVYQAIKDFKDFRPGTVSEQSLEQKSLNNLDFLIRNTKEGLMPHKDFLRTLKEDILGYATLADYTLRRIMNLKEYQFEELQKLKDELGEDYLIKEKNRLKDQKKEIIIAIENKKA